MTNDNLTFSPREVELIGLLAQGKNLREAAEAMGVAYPTIADYAGDARKKLGLKHTREIPMAYWRATGESPYP